MVTIKLFFTFSFFIFLAAVESKAELPNCGEKNIKGFNLIRYSNFNKKGEKIGEEDVITSLVSEWSNSTDNIYDIYFQSSDSNLKINEVTISYIRDADQKELSRKIFKLDEKNEKGHQKVLDFKFQDGVMSPKDRTGTQIYTLRANGQDVCSVMLKHYYATEEF